MPDLIRYPLEKFRRRRISFDRIPAFAEMTGPYRPECGMAP
jgi:hypothetical protein